MAEVRRKKRRSSNDFLWVLIILLIVCLGVLGRQEYRDLPDQQGNVGNAAAG